ncbi:MAG TPA: glycosyltransferase family 2 protein [Thermoanaerobaculia bacterium]|nr:glycosyltransferase family 2 protein [Thermoanaerobaculia bacterium]
MLDDITPVIITGNEERNIVRTLQQLTWAKDVVVVDSMSTDATVALAQTFPNVRVFPRPFDTLAKQWSFAAEETGIRTAWILTLDADYFVTPELIEEMRALDPPTRITGYIVRFLYAIQGHRLRGSLYPPRPALLRTGRFTFYQDGHTQRVRADGLLGKLQSPMIHDDRKGVGSFITRQLRYMKDEAEKLRAMPGRGSMRDRIRRMRIVAPPLVLLHTLFVKGVIRDGWPGIFYALERTVAELILSMVLIERDLKRVGKSSDRP